MNADGLSQHLPFPLHAGPGGHRPEGGAGTPKERPLTFTYSRPRLRPLWALIA